MSNIRTVFAIAAFLATMETFRPCVTLSELSSITYFGRCYS